MMKEVVIDEGWVIKVQITKGYYYYKYSTNNGKLYTRESACDSMVKELKKKYRTVKKLKARVIVEDFE